MIWNLIFFGGLSHNCRWHRYNEILCLLSIWWKEGIVVQSLSEYVLTILWFYTKIFWQYVEFVRMYFDNMLNLYKCILTICWVYTLFSNMEVSAVIWGSKTSLFVAILNLVNLNNTGKFQDRGQFLIYKILYEYYNETCTTFRFTIFTSKIGKRNM